jgi:hypothetical protein
VVPRRHDVVRRAVRVFNLYCHPISGDSLVNRAAIGDKGCGSNDLIFFVESSSSINSGTVGH